MNTRALTAQQIAEAGLDGWVVLVSYGLGGKGTHTELINHGGHYSDLYQLQAHGYR
jgi:ABC-type multidrug transport system fused ATPase/permease subunit